MGQYKFSAGKVLRFKGLWFAAVGFAVLGLNGSWLANHSFAQRDTSPNQATIDSRDAPLKTLDSHFPFTPPESLDAWESRKTELRRRVLVATGLWPMPDRPPVESTIHGLVERDGFTVEKVYFESLPGHYVTGLLFRPENATGQRPGILCPHGHGGRMQQYSEKEIRQQIAIGAERFEGSGKFPKLARCAQLARMGCVVFMFDMLGYGDSQQISDDVAHRFRNLPDEYQDGKLVDGGWGFYTVQAELRLQSIMGLQTFNAIRSLDFLEQLPDVDPTRMAVTGNSGGGTQTILLGAIDPRPVALFPNGMVSTSMQGGCTCENCSLLRIETGNVELAAVAAPIPQAMTAADDWTIDMMTDGYPQLQQVYALYDAVDQVRCEDFTHFDHNFNYVTRGRMYQWFNKYLQLGWDEPIVEQDYEPLIADEAAVWTDAHPQPTGGPSHERDVTAFFTEQANEKIAEVQEKPEQYLNVVGGAWQTIIGRSMPDPSDIRLKTIDQIERDSIRVTTQVLEVPRYDEIVPLVKLQQVDSAATSLTIYFTRLGRGAMWTDMPEVQETLRDGGVICFVDLYGQSDDFITDLDSAIERRPTAESVPQRIVENGRLYAGYTFGYNPPRITHQIHDAMSLFAGVKMLADELKDAEENVPISIHSAAGTEGVVKAALFVQAVGNPGQAPKYEVQFDSNDFRFGDVTDYRDPNFLPGSVKYGDLPALDRLLEIVTE